MDSAASRFPSSAAFGQIGEAFDRPQAGRAFFEGLIRDHLDLGRPDQVVLVFDRKRLPRTPGRFRTRVVTRGVEPQLSCTYKSCRLKQYWKAGRALRTETVISDTRDFGIGRRICAKNWNERPTGCWRKCQPASGRCRSADRSTSTRCGHAHSRDPALDYSGGTACPGTRLWRPAGYGLIGRPGALQPRAGRLH